VYYWFSYHEAASYMFCCISKQRTVLLRKV